MGLYCVIHNTHRHLKALKRINKLDVYLFSQTEKVLFLNTNNIEVNHAMKPNEKKIIFYLFDSNQLTVKLPTAFYTLRSSLWITNS